MNYSPTLTEQEFTDLHNGRCRLQYVASRLRDVLNPKLMADFDAALEQIQKSLARSYEAEAKKFDEEYSANRKIQKMHRFKTEWSISGTDMNAQHPFPDAKYLEYSGISFPIIGNTWLDLWDTANEVVKESEDEHHIFIEAFSETDDPDKIQLSTGS